MGKQKLEVIEDPSRYPKYMIRQAACIALQLDRGTFVLLLPPPGDVRSE